MSTPAVRTFLSLGSNLGDRRQHLSQAIESLPDVVAVSPVYETEPVGGPGGQGPYLNLVVELHTPIADCFLNGITRQTVIDLAKRRGIGVCERRIMPEELATFNEAFVCGTGAEVTPVSEIGPYKFTPGNISRTLIEDYAAEVTPKQPAF